MFTLFRRWFGPLGPPLALVLILYIGGPAMRLDGAEPARRSFALAAGDAENTLEAFSIQADVQIVFLVGDVHGVTTQPVQGAFAIREALDRMIARTGLRVEVDGNSGAYVVRRASTMRAAMEAPQPKNQTLPKSMEKSSRAFLAAFAGWLIAGTSAAQSIDTTSTAASAKEEDAIVLSPFVVNTQQDVGYRAASTLSGSKLNTNLRDVASSISVVTKDFLQDTGSTNLEDILVYTVGTEVNGLGGNFSNFGQMNLGRKFQENSSGAFEPMSTTRLRGLAAADQARNFFNSGIPTDAYNVDRIDINRGANSALFGLGSPAGIINSTLIAPRFKDSAEVKVRVDSENSFRTSLDLNRVVVPNRVALRVAALHDDQRFRQKPAFVEDRRYFGAVKARVFKETTFDAFFELVDQVSNRPRVVPPLDQLSNWFNYGKPVYRPDDPNALKGTPKFSN